MTCALHNHGIIGIQDIVLHYHEHYNVRNPMNSVSLGLWNFNHFYNSFVMMFTPNPPSNRSSLTRLLPTSACIITMWRLIAIEAITRVGLSTVTLLFLGLNLVATYCIKFEAILKSWPKVNVCLLSNNC